jgi:gliding motility-associated-like protein
MSCQIFEGDKSSSITDQAIVYAADNGAVICQNSWGYDNPDVYNPSELTAIQYFINNAGKDKNGNPRPGTKMNGGIVIFAAGNDDSNGKWYPAYSDNVTAVSAIGYNGKKAYYSNYGSWVDIAAPGGDAYHGMRGGTILSTIPTNSSHEYKESTGYGWMQGTSMACPHVSGVAALILSKYGSATYTPDMLRKRLTDSVSSLAAYDPTYASLMGKGLLNAERALSGAIIHASNVTINNCITEVNVGSTWTLSATVTPNTAINKNVTFSSSNSAVIALSESNGQTIATGVAPGQAVITVTTEDGGLEDACSVKVVIPVTGVTIEPRRLLKLHAGDTIRFWANITPTNAENKKVEWTWSPDGSKHGITRLNDTSCLVTIHPSSDFNNSKKAVIIVTTEENHELKDMEEIYTYDELYAPEGFSPNGDGVNDYFVFVLDPHESYALTVFDRSGQVHFRFADYQNEWYGMANTGPYSGNKLPAGTYFYTLSAKGSGQVKKDFVVIKY